MLTNHAYKEQQKILYEIFFSKSFNPPIAPATQASPQESDLMHPNESLYIHHSARYLFRHWNRVDGIQTEVSRDFYTAPVSDLAKLQLVSHRVLPFSPKSVSANQKRDTGIHVESSYLRLVATWFCNGCRDRCVAWWIWFFKGVSKLNIVWMLNQCQYRSGILSLIRGLHQWCRMIFQKLS